MLLEIACFSITSAKIALDAGADRLELCTNRAAGGLTPGVEDFRHVLEYRKQAGLMTPIFVMIRPRGGDFVYCDEEIRIMMSSLVVFRNLGADGFVFGILTADNHIDTVNNERVAALAGPRPCTFHRAFDWVRDQETAAEEIRFAGFNSILTSGGAEDVEAGQGALVELFAGKNGQMIMPGGGLRSSNIKSLKTAIPAEWWHSSAIMGLSDEADAQEIRALKSLIS